MKSVVDFSLLAVQIGLAVCTAFVLPLTLRPRWIAYSLYTLGTAVVWLVYSVLMLFCDGWLGKDMPGIGYLLIGFLSWCLGSAIYVQKIFHSKGHF
jgi:hypothetical protein